MNGTDCGWGPRPEATGRDFGERNCSKVRAAGLGLLGNARAVKGLQPSALSQGIRFSSIHVRFAQTDLQTQTSDFWAVGGRAGGRRMSPGINAFQLGAFQIHFHVCSRRSGGVPCPCGPGPRAPGSCCQLRHTTDSSKSPPRIRCAQIDQDAAETSRPFVP